MNQARPRRARILIASGLLVVIVAAGGVALYLRATHPQMLARPPIATARPSAVPSPMPSQQPVQSSQLQLVISKINVNAPVEVVGLDENNNMGVPEKPTDVGLYGPGAQPGQPGDAVIDGHLDWYNMPQAVFYNLSNLGPGDEVNVVDGGKTLHFKVTDSENVAYNSHPDGLFATTGAPRLTLITCAGSWDVGRSTYTQRLIVNADYTGTT